jgi:holin-like protein
MLKAILTLFVCLALGNTINRLTGLPLPGSVIGLLILLAILIWRRGPDEPMKQTGHFLLRNMTIFFIPASVGLMTQLPALQHNALTIGIAIVVSTLLGMAVTAVLMQCLARDAEDDAGERRQEHP